MRLISGCLLSFLLLSPLVGANDLAKQAKLFATRLDYPFLELSPDGKFAASAMMLDGVRQLVLISVEDKSIRAAKIQGDAVAVRWVNDQQMIVIADDPLEVPQVYSVSSELKTTLLSSFEPDSGFQFSNIELYPVGAYQDGQIRLFIKEPDGSQSKFDIDTAKLTVSAAGGFTHPRDRDFRGTTGEFQIFEEWDGIAFEVNLYNGGKKGDTLFRGDYIKNGHSGVIAYLPAEHQLLVTQVAEQIESVWQYDLVSKAFVKALLSEPGYDVAAEPVYLPYESKPVALTYDTAKPKSHYFDAELAAIMAKLDKALPDTFNVPVSASKDRSRLIILSRSPRLPGMYYLYHRDTRKLEPLLSQADWLEGLPLADTVAVRYPARDGVEIEAYLTVPPGRSQPPLIVMPHGGPHVRDTWQYDAEVQYLAALGYAIIQPNYRGSEGYGNDFLKHGFRQVGKAMQTDLYDAAKWAQAKGYGTDNRICFIGGSFGGYASIRATIDQPELVKCAVSMAGFYDVLDLLESDRERPFYPLMLQTYGDPSKDASDLAAVSATKDAGKISVPVLIAHGARDSRVDIQQAADMIDALKANKKTYLAIIREDEGHGFYRSANTRNYLLQLGSFLQNHLPVDVAATEAGATDKPYLQEYALRNADANRTLKRIFDRMERRPKTKPCQKELGSNRCKK